MADAGDQDDNLIDVNMSNWVIADNWGLLDYVEFVGGSENLNRIHFNPSAYGELDGFGLYDVTDIIVSGKNYNFSFDALTYEMRYVGVVVSFVVRYNDGSDDDGFIIAEFGNSSTSPNYINYNVNIRPEIQNKGYQCLISFGFIKGSNGSIGSNRNCSIKNLSLTEVESKETNILKRILNFVTDIKDGLMALPSTIGSFFTDLKESMSNWFDNLRTSIGSFFSDLKESMSNWFLDLKVSIVGGIDSEGNEHLSLWQRIIDGIKNLFVPSDGYFSSKTMEIQNIMRNSLGALYQSGELMIDFLGRLKNVNTNAVAEIVIPKFQFKLGNSVYTLYSGGVYSFEWVKTNSSDNVLYTLYRAYKGFMVLVCVISFIYYLRRRYNSLIGGPADDS